MEVAEAVYDGTSVTLTISIESEKNLGENLTYRHPIETNGEIEGSSTTWTKKLTETTYASVIIMTPELHGRSPSIIHLSWTPESIYNYETDEEFEGDWKFDFQLNKIEVKGVQANYKDRKYDFIFFVPRVDITGYTINIPFEIKMPSKHLAYGIDFEVKDELGHQYENITNMANSRMYVARGSFIFANLQNDAKELNITPRL